VILDGVAQPPFRFVHVLYSILLAVCFLFFFFLAVNNTIKSDGQVFDDPKLSQ